MLTTLPAFVMSSVVFFLVGMFNKKGTFSDLAAAALGRGLRTIVQFAILPNGHLADCNLRTRAKACKLLKLLGFNRIQKLARGLLYSLL